MAAAKLQAYDKPRLTPLIKPNSYYKLALTFMRFCLKEVNNAVVLLEIKERIHSKFLL